MTYSYFYDLLKDNVNNSDSYTVLFNENLNIVSQTSQMDFLLRYWDDITKMIKVQFWNSYLLGTYHTKRSTRRL